MGHPEKQDLLKKMYGVLVRFTNLPIAIALVVAIFGSFYVDSRHLQAFQLEKRSETLSKMNEIRSKLEGNINVNLQLAQGFVSALSTEPNIDQKRFSQLASRIFLQKSQLRSLAGAPDLVISLIHPLEGNEGAIGLDYRKNEEQKEAILRSANSKQVVLAGPVNLVQGGRAFIGRIPVFNHQADGSEKFWGIVSVVIDLERLYKDSGIYDETDILLALKGHDSLGKKGSLFYGSPEILTQNPVTVDVKLPSGSWHLSAMPKNGWEHPPSDLWFERLNYLLVTILLIAPISIMSWLMNDRLNNLEKLNASSIEMKHLSSRLELALNTSKIGVWEYDPKDQTVYWDRGIRAIYGVDENFKVTKDFWHSMVHPDDAGTAFLITSKKMVENKQNSIQYRINTPHGDTKYIRSIGTAIKQTDGSIRLVGVSWDITQDVMNNNKLRLATETSMARARDLEKAKNEIEHNALHDWLTNLPNRRYLEQVLTDCENRITGHRSCSGLLHIDIDRFKQINDTMGHAAGDATLIHIARMLQNKVGPADFVARVGGDEFVVICFSQRSKNELEKLASLLVEELQSPFLVENRQCRCTVSIGIVHITNSLTVTKQHLINGDIALYKAKKLGRNGYTFFSDDLHKTVVHTKKIADEILIAIEQNQFVAHYQGQFDTITNELVGVEALARWEHPQKGLLRPADFLDIAEEINVVSIIDGIILENSLRQIQQWMSTGYYVPKVSTNVSIKRLYDEHLLSKLKKHKIPRGILAFELLESIFLDDQNAIVAHNIQGIRDLGIEIEIDDFGTGYASIISLMQLRPHRLKIDRQFILPLIHSKTHQSLVKSIIAIGDTLGISAIAEGVETPEHVEILKKLGCKTLQGYALARPMSGENFVEFLQLQQKTLP